MDTLEGRWFVLSMSSKGGVGKSMVALNIAHELSASGQRVGIVGTDVDSDNVPGMLGVEAKGAVDSEDMFVPVMHEGMRVISIGVMLKKNSVVSKTGREIASIIDDIIRWTRWEDTNVIVLDMPAGVSQEVKAVIDTVQRRRMIGTVIVTTPDTFEDLERTVNMCVNKALPIAGVVVNKCGAVEADGEPIRLRNGKQYFPYGTDENIASYLKKNDIPYLGSIPLVDGYKGYRIPEFAIKPIHCVRDTVNDFLINNHTKVQVPPQEGDESV